MIVHDFCPVSKHCRRLEKTLSYTVLTRRMPPMGSCVAGLVLSAAFRLSSGEAPSQYAHPLGDHNLITLTLIYLSWKK